MIRYIITVMILFLLPVFSFSDNQDEYRNKIEAIINDSKLSDDIKAGLKEKIRETIKVGIPTRELKIVTERSLQSGIEPDVLSDWCQIMIESSGKGIPVQPIIDKIKEGLAKNVQPERIGNALNLVIERLLFGKALLTSRFSGIRTEQCNEMVEILAETLWRGVSKDALNEIAEQVRLNSDRKKEDTVENLKVSSLSISSLVGLKISADTSLEIVKSAIDHKDYRTSYLYDLVEIIRIAMEQNKGTQNEIVNMAKSSIAKNITPVQLTEAMKLGSAGIAIIQREIAQTQKELEKARKQLDDAATRVKKGMDKAQQEMEQAKGQVDKNIERMQQLKEMMERMREQMEHFRDHHNYEED